MYIRSSPRRPNRDPNRTLSNELLLLYNINNNIEVKVIVIFKGKLKLARGLLVYLVVIVVLYKVLNCLNLSFIAYLLKNPK
jgi:hypothetical protein